MSIKLIGFDQHPAEPGAPADPERAVGGGGHPLLLQPGMGLCRWLRCPGACVPIRELSMGGGRRPLLQGKGAAWVTGHRTSSGLKASGDSPRLLPSTTTRGELEQVQEAAPLCPLSLSQAWSRGGWTGTGAHPVACGCIISESWLEYLPHTVTSAPLFQI